MSTIKISQLTELTTLNANTANTVFVGVDVPSGITARFSATTLSQKLYANNVLNVGDNTIVLPNVVAQFTGTSDEYIQTNLQNDNGNGSADYVVTADIGTDTTWFIDTGIQGSSLSQGILYPLDGYVLVAGNTAAQPGGNLTIGSITSGKNLNITLGGYNTNNVVAQFLYDTGFKLNQKPIIFADGSSQNTAAWTAIQSQASFDQANTNASQIVAIQGVDTAQNTNITAVNNFAAGAYNKANNALANTSGTFAGNLTIAGNVDVLGQTSSTGTITTGNLIVNGTSTLTGNVTMNATTYLAGAVTVNSTMVLANSNFSPTEAALTITASGTTVTPSNDGYMIHISGKNGVPSRVVTDSYGTGAYSLFTGRASRGTVNSPTALANNDVIARYSSSGYGATKYQSLGVGRIDFVAAENYTDANTGSRIEFWNCAVGSNTLNKIATFNGDSVHFTGVVAPEKGFIYVPTTLPGSQTAFTIDFSTTALIKASIAADCTISLSNYVYGKVVEVWLTNTSGFTRTITHGCTATNSSVNATTFTMAGTSSAYLKYFSIDGDNANTFVAIQNA